MAVDQQDNRGIRAVTADEFSPLDAMGGIRGLVESVLPGLLFITIFQITHSLLWALVVAGAITLIMVAARLVQRTRVTQALGGVLGIAVGVFWAWRTGEAADFFAFGLWQNGIYLVLVLLGQLLWWPAVGMVIEMLRLGFHADSHRKLPKVPVEPGDFEPNNAETLANVGALLSGDADEITQPVAVDPVSSENPFAGFSQWRNDRPLLRRYWLASWFWVALFGLRLAVQLPLYFGGSVGWLGTARLLMGVPLFAAVLYATWVITHNSHRHAT